MGGGVLLVFLTVIVFVIGGLLLRGQSADRGLRWWLGWVLLIGGGASFAYWQVAWMLSWFRSN